MKLAILFFAFIAVAQGATLFGFEKEQTVKRFDNYAVFKLRPTAQWQRDVILKLLTETEHFDLWSENTHEMHLMVSPQVLSYFKNLTLFRGIPSNLWIPNVQSLLDAEQDSGKLNELDDCSDFTWTAYHSLEEIYQFLDDILDEYPEVTEEIIIGSSLEGRTIRGVRISYQENNPGVYIESNIHAREWITSATATWFIKELLTSEDPAIRAIATNNDWYIIPVFNVDGFVYTHNVDRMWRKNRRPFSASSKCVGIDLNRNWNSNWMANGGASSNPCSETYAGTEALSEPEIKAQAAYITSIKNKINILLAFHSYGQYVLSPWGHTVEEPANKADLQSVGEAYKDAVAAMPYKKIYTVGSTAEVLYVASGATNDWAYEQGIELAYTVEFRDDGYYGFVLPPAQILSNCEEAMKGTIALIEKGRELGYMTLKT